MGDLDGRTAVITGAARGIGRACALGFLDAGAAVVALDRSWEGADADELTASGRAMTAEVDITDTDALVALREAVLERFETVDVLVNNAALRQRTLFPPYGVAPILTSTDADWQRMLDVNLFGTLRTTRVFIDPMRRQGRGSVVNVGSRGSIARPVSDGVWQGGHPTLRNQPYDASKAALASLTFYLAEEVRAEGVAVNLLFPGATNTTGSADVVEGRRANGIAVPVLLRPEHVVPLALHLATRTPESGETGLALDSLKWNERNGLDAPAAWLAAI